MLIEHIQLKKENDELRETVDKLKNRVLHLEPKLRSIKEHVGLTSRDVSPPPLALASASENSHGVNI